MDRELFNQTGSSNRKVFFNFNLNILITSALNTYRLGNIFPGYFKNEDLGNLYSPFLPMREQGGWSMSSFISSASPCLPMSTGYNLDSICIIRCKFFPKINWICPKVLPNSKSLTLGNSRHHLLSIGFGEWCLQFIHLSLVPQQTAIFQKPRLSPLLVFHRVDCLATTKALGNQKKAPARGILWPKWAALHMSGCIQGN